MHEDREIPSPIQATTTDSGEKPALAERDSQDQVNLHVAEDGSLAPLVVPEEAVELASATEDAQEQPAKENHWNQPFNEEEMIGRMWQSATHLSATAHMLLWVGIGACVIVCVVTGIKSFMDYLPPGQAFMPPDDWMPFLSDLHIPGLVSVLNVLPAAVLACIAMTAAVVWVHAKSRSRRIDWTDSHLIIELSGPIALTFRWSAIDRVEQESQWELFHGRQPVFIITTREDNVFRLRLSDITYKHNIGEFFSLIKTNAPDAVMKVEHNFASDNSYTELWLKYFSAPAERDKTGMLEAGMFLDNGRYKVLNTIGGGGQGTAYFVEVNHDIAPAQYEEDGEPKAEPVLAAQTIERANLHAEVQNPLSTSETEEAPEHLEMRAASTLAQSKHIMRPRQRELSNLQHVVLKEYILPIHRGHLTAERTADKLKAEADILQKLHHPQIVGLLDAFIEDYRGYLVLDYVAGEPLKSIVDRTGPQPESVVIDWAMQVCSILRYLHGLSPPVVHRDITPDNLLLQPDGTIKIVDFNVAYQVDSSATATVVGKHAYIPAEQFRGKPTEQSDIYSLGGTMFYLLTGKEPEPITESHPRDEVDGVSASLDGIVGKATAHSLTDRYANVDEMAEHLRMLLGC